MALTQMGQRLVFNGVRRLAYNILPKTHYPISCQKGSDGASIKKLPQMGST